jgi:hypothetical protein
MKKSKELIKVFTGPEPSAILLKERLEETGIPVLIKNDSSSAFFGAATPVIDLYIEAAVVERARSLIKEFNADDQS